MKQWVFQQKRKQTTYAYGKPSRVVTHVCKPLGCFDNINSALSSMINELFDLFYIILHSALAVTSQYAKELSLMLLVPLGMVTFYAC